MLSQRKIRTDKVGSKLKNNIHNNSLDSVESQWFDATIHKKFPSISKFNEMPKIQRDKSAQVKIKEQNLQKNNSESTFSNPLEKKIKENKAKIKGGGK